MRRLSASRAAVTWSIALTCCLAIFLGAVRASGPVRTVAVRTILAATDALPPSGADGRTNILLLGIGDRDHTAADLTDAIMIASIDPKHRSALLFSIPRDLYVLETEVLSGKINSVYAYHRMKFRRQGMSETGASLAAMEKLAEGLEIRLQTEIHGVVKMDFTGFETVIDAVGGIDIDVPRDIVDSTYPVREGVLGVFSIEAGPQHFDGVTALRYARSRHSTSDFDRSDRQQQILAALAEKARGMNILTDSDALLAVFRYVRDHMETTFTLRELFGLAGLSASIPQDRILRANLNYFSGGDSSDAEAGGFIRGDGSGSTLFPLSDDPADWSALAGYYHLLQNHRNLFIEKNPITVRSAGTSAAMRHRLRNDLVRFGFQATEDRVILTGDSASRIDVLPGSDGETAEFLSTALMLPIRRVDGEGEDITIVLGKEYRHAPLFLLEKDGR